MNINQQNYNTFIPKNYFQQTIFNLQLVGIKMNGSFEKKSVRFFYFMYSAFLLITFVYFYTITEIIHVCKIFHNMEELLFTISYLLAHLIGVAKITVLLLKRKAINTFLESLKKENFLPNIHRGGPQEITLIKQAVSKMRTQVNIFWMIVTIMLSNRMIWIIKHPTIQYVSSNNNNITLTVRQLPYANSYPIQFDVQKSPYYEFVFIHQVVSTWIFGWYLGNADTITNGLIIHLTAQFKIVSNAFVTVTEVAKKLVDKNNCKIKDKRKMAYKFPWQHKTMMIDEMSQYDQTFLYYLKKCTIKCIKHHQATLKLAEDMENTFNLMLLIQFLGCLCIYGLQLYQLSLLPIKSTSFLSMSFFLVAMIFQLLLYCWNGNEMSITSETVAYAAYTTEWIPADKTTKTLIMMTIMRAQRPVYITAGKFSKLSLATFAAIIRGSFSYFTVLRNMNDVNE